jgi:hypothetical protein
MRSANWQLDWQLKTSLPDDSLPGCSREISAMRTAGPASRRFCGDRISRHSGRSIAFWRTTVATVAQEARRLVEHEARLKDLLAKQAQLNAFLDIDKHEAQVADEPRKAENKAVPARFAPRPRREP